MDLSKKRKPDKSETPSILETDLVMEMKPADARKYLERGFELLIQEAETASDSHVRLDALRGISQYYSLVIMKDGLDESVNRMARTQEKTLDEVKRLRHKPWDKDTTDNSEE